MSFLRYVEMGLIIAASIMTRDRNEILCPIINKCALFDILFSFSPFFEGNT